MRYYIYLLFLSLFIAACAPPKSDKQMASPSEKTSAQGEESDVAEELPSAGAANDAPQVSKSAEKRKQKKDKKSEADFFGQLQTQKLNKETQQLYHIEVLEGVTAGKAPVKSLFVKLLIRNNHEVPMWYLMPRKASESLGESSRLVAPKERKQPFNGRLYHGFENKGKLVEVNMYGGSGAGFKAFWVPAKSSITFRNYEIEDAEDVEQIELWSAQGLWVNAQTQLQKWLPYPIQSDADVVVKCDKTKACDWINLDWDEKTDALRQDYPNETVSFVQAQNPIKHYISLKGLEN